MRDWVKALAIILGVTVIFVAAARKGLEAQAMAVQAASAAEITAEEQERREQAAYYKGWQDGKQYYLENFGGIN